MAEMVEECIGNERLRGWYDQRDPIAAAAYTTSLVIGRGAVERSSLPPVPAESATLQGKEALRSRAQAMRDRFAANAHAARTQYTDKFQGTPDEPRAMARLTAVDEQDRDACIELGLPDMSSAWLGDIVGCMVAGGKLNVRLSTYNPERVVDGFGNTFVEYSGMKQAPFISGRTGALLRDVYTEPGAVQSRIVVHDYLDPVTGWQFDTVQQEKGATIGLQLMQELGAVSLDPTNPDWSLQRTSALVPQVAELVDRLKTSGAGSVVHDKQGRLRFLLIPRLTGVKLSADRMSRWHSEGLCILDTDGTPSVAALEAAGYVQATGDESGEGAMHVAVIDPSDGHSQYDAFALAQAAGVIRHDTYHPLILKKVPDADLFTYNLASMLQHETEEFLRALDKYDDVQALDPYKYIDHNYGQDVEHHPWGVVPEDRQIVEHLLRVLPKHLAGRTGLHGINIGRGPYSYLEQVLEPYLGSVELADPAESARKVIRQAKDHTLPEAYNPALKFEQLLAVKGGPEYKGSNDRILEKATITDRGIRDMPAGQYDVVFESFVSCSRSPYKSSFWADIRAKRQALRDEHSLMVSLHMVGAEGWGYAGSFPSAKMSLDEVRQGYLDAGMEVLEFIPVSSEDKLHEGYHGMAIVVARPRRQLLYEPLHLPSRGLTFGPVTTARPTLWGTVSLK